MDLTPIVLGVAAINLGVFLAGCLLALARTWREAHPTRPSRAHARHARHDLAADPLAQPTR
jgi:hypothetical protein